MSRTAPRRAEAVGGTPRYKRRGQIDSRQSFQRAELIKYWKVSNIDQGLRNPKEHAGSITAPRWRLPVTESFALPPDSKVECNDRLPSRNPTARNPATPLPEMPNAHEACADLAGTRRI
jgi:hypothetical protein